MLILPTDHLLNRKANLLKWNSSDPFIVYAPDLFSGSTRFGFHAGQYNLSLSVVLIYSLRQILEETVQIHQDRFFSSRFHLAVQKQP